MGLVGRGAIAGTRRRHGFGIGYTHGDLGLSDIREFPVEADSDVRLDLFVAQRAELSRTQAATLIAQGHVLVSGRPQKASYRTEAGELVTVEIPKVEKRTIAGAHIPISIVYEDAALRVVD